MNKSFIFILTLILISILLTGCWNYREIDKLAIVSGIAVDKPNSNEGYEVTAEVINVSSSMREPKFNSTRMESRGASIFDSMRNIINVSAKQLFWSHSSIIIVSEDIAKEGILPILDWVTRNSEPRLSTYIIVSEAQNARDILTSQSLTTEIRSFEIQEMIISNNKLAKIPNIQIYELNNQLAAKGINPVIPTIKIVINEDKPTMVLSGGAVLNKDKLAGYISLEDVKYYLFTRDKIKEGLLVTNLDSEDPKEKVTLEIYKNRTKITPVISNGELSINIKISTEVSIEESSNSINALNENVIQNIKLNAEKSLKNNVLRVISNVQNDFGLDIFGFGQMVREKMPKVWKDVEENWDEIFKELKVNVDTDVHIRSSGHLSKTIRHR